MNRAYSLLTVKRVSEDERLIEGLATTPEPDRMGDVVEPKGAQFKLPLPLLMHHDSRQPVGHVTSAAVTNDGIAVTARIIKFDEPGRLKDRLDEAWHTVKSGLINGLSIGFRAIERSYIEDTSSIRFTAWEWLGAVDRIGSRECRGLYHDGEEPLRHGRVWPACQPLRRPGNQTHPACDPASPDAAAPDHGHTSGPRTR
jgi:hypothetical protein